MKIHDARRENCRTNCIAVHKYARNSSFRQKVAPHFTRYDRFGPHKALMERRFFRVPGIPPSHWEVIWAAKTVEQSAYQATSMRAIRRFTKKCHPPFQDLDVLALKRQNRGMVRRSQNNLKNDTKNYWAPETGVTLAILGAKLYFHPYTSLQFWPQNAHYSTNSTHNRKKSRNRAPRPGKPGKWPKN